MVVLLVVGGCRKPLAPTFDRNQAPETWITAAPLDTITYRDGTVPKQTDPTPIAARFHLYWAGSDPDGKVAGFYYAVVETLPLPVPPAVTAPPLPGPKPQDYKYTTKTDSVFIFSVSTTLNDREHIFYIYAVDNLGRPDPTPARFIFKSFDRFKPRPIIDSFVATGLIWQQDPVTLALSRTIEVVDIPWTDTFTIGAKPRRTVANQSRLDAAWHSIQQTVDYPAVGYQYKLDEPTFISVGPTTTTVSYNTGPDDFVGPGVKIFTLRAIDRAGGAEETTRLFQMNHPPTTWFSGPDRNAPVWTHPAGSNDYYVDIIGNSWATGIPNLTSAGLLSPDSIKVMPSQRPKRKTFWEIYGNRIYARAEGDTVNMNSWVVFHNGGFDSDSPYSVFYSSNVPSAPDSNNNPVLQIRPSNGSPIGFRSRIPMRLWPSGQATGPSQTSVYPNYDPASVNRIPAVAGYWVMSQSGVAYLFARAEDGNGEVDSRVGSRADLQPDVIVKAVDSTGSANADQIALRPLIMKFFVDKVPVLNFAAANFSPQPSPGGPTYVRTFNLNMVAKDDDPYDATTSSGPGGQNSGGSPAFFRYQIRFRALRAGGGPTDSATYAPAVLDRVSSALLPSTVTIPDSLVGNLVRVMVELCDCGQCENVPGSGRCNFYSYLISTNFPQPASPAPASNSLAPDPGSGSAIRNESKRGEQ